ncbi:MAG: helix-hairpin-helix domain-containing protein [Chloroflexi bacterium]|nr:helix-hairpin-helix domain-containing protein [Chloroflexota bacterium]
MTQKTSLPIDLNTADESTLVEGLQISARLAKRIIALRPYASAEEINKVWGIEPAELQRILPLVKVSGQNKILSDIVTRLVGEREPKASPKPLEQKQPALSLTEEIRPRPLKEKVSWKVNLLLVLILLAGAFFRFTGLNWDDNHHQHPDERFISMVADQIRWSGVEQYLDSGISPLNPLRFGSYTYGMFPLFFTRAVAEWLGMTNYDSITLAGRAISGLFDLLAVWMLYLLATRLYNRRVGLLAAALGAAAVLPIQLSHYFAVDSFSTVFVIAGFYFALQAIPIHSADEKIYASNLTSFGLFGFIIGLAGACKVNTLPVFGIIILAGIAYLIAEWKKPKFTTALIIILVGWILAAFTAFIAFRIFQPYAFSGPEFFSLTLNEKWLRVMKEVINQVGGNSDWPPNTHWTNRPATYAFTNMVVWGLGIPLGLAGWLGWAWAAKKLWNGEWHSHLLPLVWVGGYFIWQNVQFWRYMRYFLPIYPFIILFAAWALMEIYDQTREGRARLSSNGMKLALQISDWRFTWKGAAGLALLGITLIGTYIYALAFIQIYTHPITRVAASEWMLENISAPLNVIVQSPQGNHSYPVAVGNNQTVEPGNTGSANIYVLQYGTASSITTADVRQVGVSFYFKLTRDAEGNDVITQGRLTIDDNDQTQQHLIPYGDINLDQGTTYYFHYKIQSSSQFSISNVMLRHVDESLPALFVDLNLQSQSGSLQGSVPVMPQETLVLNRLDIKNFQQTFVPSETTLKVTIFKEEDTNTPLVETSQTLVFSKPGLRLSPTFKFSPIELLGDKTYQVRYEITDGYPLHLFGESFTLETSWDDALPLNINRYDVQGGIFMPMNLELYEPDTPEKREAMIQTLADSEYIVIPSNRAYDAMPRLPLRYPLALKYYQALFDCECSGDALENRAYGLEAPFKSPLGFELVATFENPPALGFLRFPDQSADESFTVYDHPKVLIFKKSQDFSIEKVRALLNSVDLSQVLYQNPSQYTKAPTAMRLPVDRLEAQRNSTDWSAIFNRYSSLNTNPALGGAAWYLLLFLLGLIVFPIVYNIFSWLPDRGYPLMRMAGLLVITWLVWMLGSFKVLQFTQLTIWLCIGLVLLLNAVLAYRQREALAKYFSSNWKHILGVEAIFLALFLLSLSIRLGNPDLWNPWLGGEKPMDFSFLNAVLKAAYFPPEHPWFADHYINYYYYGYIIAAIPTKLLGILPSIAYNLILPAWFAMTGIGVFSVGFNLVAGFYKKRDETGSDPAEAGSSLEEKGQNFDKALPYLAGAFALIAVMLLGNLFEVRLLWKYLPEVSISGPNTSSPYEHIRAVVGGAVRVLTGETALPGNNGRWYFEASRPILPEGPDTPIAEFPYFTFLYGDMHPHLLAMPIYALALGWLLNLLLSPASRKKWTSLIPGLIAAGLIFGSFRAVHTWDFPTFVGLGVLVIFWDAFRTKTDSIKETVQTIVIHEVAFIGIVIAFYWPFTQWFKTGYASVEIWNGARTPLKDYFFVFGLPLFLMLSLLIRNYYADLWDGYQNWKIAVRQRFLNIFKWQYLKWYLITPISIFILTVLWILDYQLISFGILFLMILAYLVFLRREMPAFQRITWLLFGLGISITLFVEIFVLKGDVGRMNTVFRFYMQAWFIFGLAASLALVDLLAGLEDWKHWTKYAWGLILIVLVLCADSYPLIATKKKIADTWPGIQNPSQTTDGALFMMGDTQNLNPAIYDDNGRLLNLSRDYAAILYMQDHIAGSPVIVEGHTDEYRWGSRFSIYTGLPSVVGWSWHVRQHNSLLDGAIIDRLIDSVNTFYNTNDIQAAGQFLDRYQVQYIILGDLERSYYNADGINKFQEMVNQGTLKIVFGDNSPNTTTIFEVVK